MLWRQWTVISLVSFAYIMFMHNYRSFMGDGIFSFTIVPIVLAGALTGLKGGLFTSFALSAFNLSYNTYMGMSFQELMTMPIPVTLSYIALGGFVGKFRDITLRLREELTQRKLAEEKVGFMAYHDDLTGLPNRVSLQEFISNHANGDEISAGFALLFMDIDRFKSINDAWGHEVGDELLKTVAVRLIELVGTNKVFRFGGDEFVIIVTGSRCKEDVIPLITQIFDTLNKDFQIDDKSINVSVSIGLVFYPEHGDNINILLKNADVTMYQAKERGKKTYQIFSPEIAQNALKRTMIENSFRQAIDCNELVLNYQPIINLATGKIIRLEALVRWNHPEFGLLMPGDFIDIAEETGAIKDIDEWVLCNAVLQLKQWHRAGFDQLHLAVNLSAYELRLRQLANEWSRILKSLEINPDYIELEITESALVGDSQLAAWSIKELKKQGIHLAIDDFGTGYSSLGYMMVYPIDTIKIDRTFVRDLVEDRISQAIVQAVIGMGKHLRRTVVAEGVETIAQLDYLRSLGCDEVQGYLFSPPVSAEVITNMLREDGVWAKTQDRKEG